MPHVPIRRGRGRRGRGRRGRAGDRRVEFSFVLSRFGNPTTTRPDPRPGCASDAKHDPRQDGEVSQVRRQIKRVAWIEQVDRMLVIPVSTHVTGRYDEIDAERAGDTEDCG